MHNHPIYQLIDNIESFFSPPSPAQPVGNHQARPGAAVSCFGSSTNDDMYQSTLSQ